MSGKFSNEATGGEAVEAETEAVEAATEAAEASVPTLDMALGSRASISRPSTHSGEAAAEEASAPRSSTAELSASTQRIARISVGGRNSVGGAARYVKDANGKWTTTKSSDKL